MIKKMSLIIVVSFIVLSVSGCSEGKNDGLRRAFRKYNLDGLHMVSSPIMLDGDKFYYTHTEDHEYYFYVASPGEPPKELSHVNNYVVSRGVCAYDYPYIYDYVGFFDNENREDSCPNHLVAINIEDSSMSTVKSEDGSLPALQTYMFDHNVVTIKTVRNGDFDDSFIDCYNPRTKERKQYCKCSYDDSCRKGEGLLGLCSNEDNLFLLHIYWESADSCEVFLDILDKDYSLVDSIKFDNELQEAYLSSIIVHFQAFGNHLFVGGTVDGLLFHIDNGQIIEDYGKFRFSIGTAQPLDNPVFYSRWENKIYLLDDDNNLVEYEINIENDYKISHITSGKDACVVIVANVENRISKVYLIGRDLLTDASFTFDPSIEE